MNGSKLIIDDSRVHLIGVVKGLVSEAEKLKKNMQSSDLDFDVGGLPISKEELEGLRDLMGEGSEEGPETDIEPSTPEKIYAEKLSRFGEVSLPPPAYTFFLKYCSEHDIDIKAFDMDEEHYTMAYCDHVTGVQWIRQALREKRLSRKKIKAKTPEEFALKWDEIINKLKGFQELEEHREEIMAKNIRRLSKKGVMIAIVEEERMEGIIGFLKEYGARDL